MAKMNKIMPPRNTTIRGQDHLLAYITPEEAQMLMDNGGAGKPGPMGIPAFYSDEDDAFAGAAMESFESDYGGAGDGNDSYDTISKAAEKDYGTPDPTKQQIESGRGFDFGSDASDALIAQIQGGYGGQLLNNKYAGSGFENQMFFDQLPDRLANAKANYGLGPFGASAGALGAYQLNKMRDLVLAGGIPGFNAAVPRGDLTGYGDRKFQGVFSKGPFGFDVYTGMPIEGNELTGWTPYDTQGGYQDQTVKPVNPETGQCDEGYMFDEDMQACRLDTGFAASGQTGGGVMAQPGDAYARMGLLDQAPTGLPEFQQQYGAGFGTPSQFTDANLAFRQRGAYRPEYFDQPYPTTGYTLLS